MVKSLLFISHTPFWFIRSYIMLFLVAPVVNHYLENITPTRRLYLMLALGWIAVYLGTVGEIRVWLGERTLLISSSFTA